MTSEDMVNEYVNYIKGLTLGPLYPSDSYRSEVFTKALTFLDQHHSLNNQSYANFVKCVDLKNPTPSEKHVPAEIFKIVNLKTSYMKSSLERVYRSSGTNSEARSLIFIDSATSSLQQTVFNSLFKHWTGGARLPMLILHPPQDRNSVRDASLAASSAFKLFSKGIYYPISRRGEIDPEALELYLKSVRDHDGGYVFGFSFQVYIFLQQLQSLNSRLKAEILNTNSRIYLVHGGGWKRLADLKIDAATLLSEMRRFFGNIYELEYYGMVEQLGSLFFKCNAGFFHPSIFSEIEVYDSHGGSLEDGSEGLIGVTSLLPISYPGHRLLTSDIGRMYRSCRCGLAGRSFSLDRRVESRPLRGCGNV